MTQIGSTTSDKKVNSGCCDTSNIKRNKIVIGSLTSDASELPTIMRKDCVSLLTREIRSPVLAWLKKLSGNDCRCAKILVRKSAIALVDAQLTRYTFR